MYRSWKRDANEHLFTELLDRYHIEWLQGKPGDGYDLLVLMQPVEMWEIKNPDLKPSARKLTESEQKRKEYCRTVGIPYQVLEYTDQAVDVIAAFLRNMEPK